MTTKRTLRVFMGLANQESHRDLGSSLRVPRIRISSHVYVLLFLLLFHLKCGTGSAEAHVRILRLLHIMVRLRGSISRKQITSGRSTIATRIYDNRIISLADSLPEHFVGVCLLEHRVAIVKSEI